MKTIEELQQEIEDGKNPHGVPECSLSDLMHRELLAESDGDMAMMMFLDICIDYFNEWDRIDEMYELWENMVRDEYKPTYDAFKSYMIHEPKPKYMPTDEDELNEVLDGRSGWKRSCEKTQNEMVEKFGVEWLSMDGDERLAVMMKDMQDNPLPNDEPRKDNDDEIDYQDLPF